MPLLGHTIKAEAFHSLVQVYVKVQYNVGPGIMGQYNYETHLFYSTCIYSTYKVTCTGYIPRLRLLWYLSNGGPILRCIINFYHAKPTGINVVMICPTSDMIQL